ncbi:hypothetical protein FOA43_002603 [Brettanomyces nanus]|uniref:Vacuolar protein sorting-associated protein 27 n=1 Tax=Eeniella nana TaxID=13502 RepID=A0A875S2W3_EENNA|nr:uncharacterized protein FOA43_002603 [Brettanomyces nanus]QPG75253.1 hypothetical protein FOA43_002603 [Brettanomyces nanus]
MRRFIGTKNPNLQRSALKLIDFCIKNGGEHFLIDIASKEFMDPFVGILHDKELNTGIKTYLLELIQSWSIMFSTHLKLTYVNDVYKKLQDEKYQFPEITESVDSSLIESRVAPEWEDSDACMLCSKLFTFLNRKHHCRSCGGVFCNEHSSQSCELPEFGITVPVRVCDTCYQEHMNKLSKQKKSKKRKSKKKGLSNTEEEDDDDFKKAIELSLKEAGITPEGQLKEAKTVLPQVHPPEYEDEDEAMNAAIAASLADMNGTQQQQQTSAVTGTSVQSSADGFYSNILPTENTENINGDYSQSQMPMQFQNQPSSFITPVEENNIVLFVKLLDSYLKTPESQRRPFNGETAIHQIYNSIEQIQMKVTQNIAEKKKGLDHFQEMYSKLFAIGKVYDDILQTRLKQHQRQNMQQQQFQEPQRVYDIPEYDYKSSSIPPLQSIQQRPSMPLPSSPHMEARGSSVGSIGYAPIPHGAFQPSSVQESVPPAQAGSAESPVSPVQNPVHMPASPPPASIRAPGSTTVPASVPEPVNLIDL